MTTEISSATPIEITQRFYDYFDSAHPGATPEPGDLIKALAHVQRLGAWGIDPDALVGQAGFEIVVEVDDDARGTKAVRLASQFDSAGWRVLYAGPGLARIRRETEFRASDADYLLFGVWLFGTARLVEGVLA